MFYLKVILFVFLMLTKGHFCTKGHFFILKFSHENTIELRQSAQDNFAQIKKFFNIFLFLLFYFVYSILTDTNTSPNQSC